MSRILPETTLLVVVDVQKDFCPGGALAVPEGDQVVSVINGIAPRFSHAVLTQDWHPPGHHSFASSHPGKEPFQTYQAPYGEQVLWPDHCVQHTPGAEFHPGLEVPCTRLILRKGYNQEIDSYSIFFENDRKTPTGLGGYAKEKGFQELYLTGLATDFCVHWSALDGRKLGFEVTLLLDACRAIDLEGSEQAALDRMKKAGVRILSAGEL